MPERSADADAVRWLLLIHQIPPKPNYLRVKIGRRLQRLGAVAIKNSVYALPRGEQAYEDFEWIRKEIAASGGQASVCEARFVDGLSDGDVEGLFNADREADYGEVTEDARKLRSLLKRRKKLDEDLRAQIEAGITRLRKRQAEIVAVEFFSAPGGQATEAILASLEQQLREFNSAVSPTEKPRPPAEKLSGRTWVTRKGIHVDRMASAWLIQRFIDPQARFKFVLGRGYRRRPDELHFDMFEAEYTHEGDRCTFEVLVQRFGLEDPGLKPIAEIIHDIDLKDSKFARPETLGLDRLIAGICMSSPEDEARLALGGSVFEALYEYFRKKRA